MGRKKTPGLVKRGDCWHIDKQVRGRRLCESTGESDLGKAEEYLARKIEEIRQASVYGVRPVRTFRMAATKFLNESTKRSLDRDADCLKQLDSFIGDMDISKVHMGTLQPYIETRKMHGIKSGTVARDLAVVRRILTLSARVWRDENNLPWIDTPPLLQLPDWEDSAEPYPLTWEEQRRFFKLMPDYLHKMALFKVNTGLREQGVCWLRWDWEVKVPALNTSIFITPGKPVAYDDGIWPGEKNKEDQIVVLNRIAQSVVDGQRGLNSRYVFPYKEKRLERMHTTAWKNAWKNASLPCNGSFNKGPHNLKHTFGRRLRAAGVSFETRKVLLHHTTGDVTTHYSSAELKELIDAVNSICDMGSGVSLTVLKRAKAG